MFSKTDLLMGRVLRFDRTFDITIIYTGTFFVLGLYLPIQTTIEFSFFDLNWLRKRIK